MAYNSNYTGAEVEALLQSVERSSGMNAVTSLSGVPVTKEKVKATLSASSETFTLAASPALAAGEMVHVVVEATAAVTITLPTDGANGWVNKYGEEKELAAGDWVELSVLFDGTNNILRVIE